MSGLFGRIDEPRQSPLPQAINIQQRVEAIDAGGIDRSGKKRCDRDPMMWAPIGPRNVLRLILTRAAVT